VVPTHYGSDDSEAEYDSPSTIDAIRRAIESYGHEVVELEATPELPAIAAGSQLDLVFNIAEGIRGRSRESQIPALLELLDIPYTGSDPATLSITLDEALAKRMVRQAGVPTPDFMLMRTGNERLPRSLCFPVIVKPNIEGSSKGVDPANVAQTEEDLRSRAQSMITTYRQPVLVEAFLSGREFTLGLLGEHRPRVLPPMEIVFQNRNGNPPVY
jgi:D-alanine-D-alanine ligase